MLSCPAEQAQATEESREKKNEAARNKKARQESSQAATAYQVDKTSTTAAQVHAANPRDQIIKRLIRFEGPRRIFE